MEKVILIKDKPFVVKDCKNCYGSGTIFTIEPDKKCKHCKGYGYIAYPVNVFGEPK